MVNKKIAKKKPLVKKRAKTILKNIGKGPNININIDQSKRSTKKSIGQTSQPRQPQVISTFTPSGAPPQVNIPFFQPTQNSNPFESTVKDTQKAKIHEEPNELEKPKPKEKEPEENNHEVFEMATQTDKLPEGKTSLIEIANQPRERISLGNGSNVMTISNYNHEHQAEDKQVKKFQPFQGEGNKLSDEPIRLLPTQLRLYRQEKYREDQQIQPPPEKKEIQPAPKKKEINNFLDQDQYEQYKKLTKKYHRAEQLPVQEINKEPTELELKSEYEKVVNGLNKDQLRLEAERRDIDVKGKSLKQVRNILLGKQDDFKLEPPPEEKQMANLQEERQKRIERINGMSINQLRREASSKGIKYENKGKVKEKLRELLLAEI
jgi:hypothetical protein